MTRITEQGIEGGRAYSIETDAGERVVAAIHDNGVRELRFFRARHSTPATTVRLDDDDARRLGAVLSGTRFRPSVPPEVRRHIGDLAVDWVRIEPGCPVVGRSLTELDLHRATGMTAIAIVRGDETLASPLADVPLMADDRVVVVGQLRQMRLVQDLLTGGA